MDKEEKLIKRYLKDELGLDRAEKTPACPDEQALLEYLKGILKEEESSLIEHHLAGCGFCLSQLSLAAQSDTAIKQRDIGPLLAGLANKTKLRLGIYRGRDLKGKETKAGKKKLFLAGTIVFFTLSFLFPKYFIQFLAGALILGMRWAFESEGGRTLIMVLDSWRHHSRDKDDEISHRLKKRL